MEILQNMGLELKILSKQLKKLISQSLFYWIQKGLRLEPVRLKMVKHPFKKETIDRKSTRLNSSHVANRLFMHDALPILKDLMESGMDVARLNFSHGDFAEHGARIKNIKQAAKEVNKSVAILLDTKGPEIRTGSFKNGEASIQEGNNVSVSMKDEIGTAERFSVTYGELIDDVHIGSKILLDDGLIELEVIELDQKKNEIITKALISCFIKDKKGVNVPNVKVNLPGMTEEDAKDIEFGIEQEVDFIAPSFIRRQADVIEIKALLEKHDEIGRAHV